MRHLACLFFFKLFDGLIKFLSFLDLNMILVCGKSVQFSFLGEVVDKLVLQILKDPDREIVVLAIGAGFYCVFFGSFQHI
jgi:hypothetical protein